VRPTDFLIKKQRHLSGGLKRGKDFQKFLVELIISC